MRKPTLKWFGKKAKKGFRGYPVGTVTLYGPDDKKATKVAVGVTLGEGQEPADLQRWFSEQSDVRADPQILAEVQAFMKTAGAKTIVMVGRIIGCPHEEGTDYEGSTCPPCPYWVGRGPLDRRENRLTSQTAVRLPADNSKPFSSLSRRVA